MSARMGDVGTLSSARFSQTALGRYGQALTLALGEVVQALLKAGAAVTRDDGPCRRFGFVHAVGLSPRTSRIGALEGTITTIP
jgi:hypothetical protein